jgi:hypothetical protein
MAKGHKPNRYIKAQAPEHEPGRVRTAFNTLMASGAALALIWVAEHAIEKWLDQKADNNSPATPDITIPVEVPANTYGVVPYSDPPSDGKVKPEVKAEKKAPSLADGVIWNEKGSKSVRPSIVIAQNETVDVILDELRAEAAAELERRALTKKPFITQKEKSGTTLPTEQIIPDKIATPPKLVKPQEEWVPIESLNKPVKPIQAPEMKDKPVIKEPVGKTVKKNAALMPEPNIFVAPTARVAPVSFGARPKLVEKHSDGSEVYTVGQRIITLRPDVAMAFNKIQSETLPREMIVAVCARESSCIPKAVNKYTEACGLFQLMPTKEVQTLYRLAYTQGPAHGFPEARELVTQYVFAKDKKGRSIFHYQPKNQAAKAELARLCLNPDFNAKMFAIDITPKIEKYESWLKGDAAKGRKVSTVEVAVINNLGDNGAIRYMDRVFNDVRTGQNTRADKVLGPLTAAQNPSLVKYPDQEVQIGGKTVTVRGKFKTMRESYRDLAEKHGGYAERDQLRHEL